MAFSLCTWNINSVRLRADLVAKLLREHAPDVLCLQETKSPVDKIPVAIFEQLGWKHMQARGEKGYNGVAILSKLPLEPVEHVDWVQKGDARHVAARLPDGTVVHNLYVPAGGDEPDVAINPKFDHKLKFVDQMTAHFAGQPGEAILVGDLNIAPAEDDVWSAKALAKVISFTPVEREKFEAARIAGGWEDVVRKHLPEGKLYSWWSYRAKDWDAADKGRRLDHVWATPATAARSTGASVLREARGWEKPSDHAPVFAHFGD